MSEAVKFVIINKLWMICHEEKKENFAGFRRNGRWEKTEQIISIDADALCIPSMNRSREEAAGQNGCREQRYAEEEMRMQQEQRRRVGARMQRNHQKQMEMRRRRKRGEIILCVLLVVILAGLLGRPNCTRL